MQASDRDDFKTEMGKLCAGFGVPFTKIREDAYWTGLTRMSLPQFRRCVEYALGEHFVEEDLPTTGKLWKVHRGDAPLASSHAGRVQNPGERLCEHVMRTLGRRLTPKQIRETWTYIGSAGGEIAGVIIRGDGEHCGFRMMLADIGAPQLELT